VRQPPGFSAAELTGQTRRHVVAIDAPKGVVHHRIVKPLAAMRAAAAREGIDLALASTFRDFDTQVRIWNEKWTGRRALLARDGRALEAAALTPARRVAAILAWSAMPGGSRHHWGTDVDVFDRAAVARDYRLRLEPDEYAASGPFARLTAWLDSNMARFGFYRPYAIDRGGVAPEPWHLSHAPTARAASRSLREATIRNAIAASGIEGKAALLRALPVAYTRYVRSVDKPPRSAR
jgi:LAS superfamily LD-carboxypeptidase LdcB